MQQGRGAVLVDVDGNRYIDYVGSWGPLILGHAHPAVISAVEEALRRGSSFGAATEGEILLSQEIRKAFPGMEKVRLVSSGTEAAMSAIRLARGATGRNGLVKCDGCYHGHVDALLVAAGSGAATLGLPGSAGVPRAVVEKTLVVPFNDPGALEELLRARGEEIACFIVEPVAGNMGCIPPDPGYLQSVRRLTEQHGVLLILDEVMTGFRVAAGGAQQRYGVTADLTTLGKIIGGGLPVGAYGGTSSLMDQVAPEGPVYQAGTLSGNPLAVAAGRATLAALQAGSDAPYRLLEQTTSQLADGLRRAAAAAGVPVQVNQVGSMFTLFFAQAPVRDFTSAKRSDTGRFARFFHGMLERGVALPPSQFESAFVSLAHTAADIERTLEAAQDVLRRMGQETA